LLLASRKPKIVRIHVEVISHIGAMEVGTYPGDCAWDVDVGVFVFIRKMESIELGGRRVKGLMTMKIIARWSNESVMVCSLMSVGFVRASGKLLS
jgi:hypothetical protein